MEFYFKSELIRNTQIFLRQIPLTFDLKLSQQKKTGIRFKVSLCGNSTFLILYGVNSFIFIRIKKNTRTMTSLSYGRIFLRYGRIFCLESQKIDGKYQRYNHYFKLFLLKFYLFFT